MEIKYSQSWQGGTIFNGIHKANAFVNSIRHSNRQVYMDLLPQDPVHLPGFLHGSAYYVIYDMLRQNVDSYFMDMGYIVIEGGQTYADRS